MNKIVKKLLLVSAAALLVTGCNHKSSSNQNTSGSSDSSMPEEEKYKVSVTSPSGIEYELSHEYAKKGETVTLRITSVGAGISIKSVVLNSKTELQGNADKTEYSFTMPDQSARIVISLSISGDVVVEGDVVAALTQDPATGIFCAKGIKAQGANKMAKINFAITSSGEKTVLGCLDLDETRSFGNIEICYEKDYALEIANGYTYDFYYNPNAVETPCYIQRSGVDVLPSDVSSLQDLLIVNRTVRSEYAVYPEHLVGAHYKVSDKTTNDVITKEMDWKLYENNVSFAKIEDTFDPDNVDPMYVYKSFDEDNGLYTVVDTYKKYEGSKLSNDDYYRLTYNGNNANSGRYSIIQGDDYGYRFAMSDRHAYRNVRTFAHMPNYFLERDMMYSYRVGFSSDSGMANWDINIASTATSTGFDVAVNSYAEYTKNAGAEKDECYKYVVNMSFNNAGAMTNVTYKESLFGEKEWDFSGHIAKTGVKGTVVKSIVASYTYGNVYSGSPDMGDFNPNDYFVQSFNGLQFFNTKSDNQAAKDAGKSIVGMNDDIYIMDGDGEFSSLVVNKKCYAPLTALDLWQYGITSSSDETVIKKEANDVYYQVSAIGIGKANVTVSNHVPGTGCEANLEIEVIATSKVRDFYLTAIDTDCIALGATIKAGGQYSFKINQFPKDSALLYKAVSQNTDLLTIVSAPNSPVLTIDVSKAANITVNTEVKVKIEADYASYEYSGSTYTYSTTYFTFTILPADVDPTGRWNAVASDMPDTYINFTNEVYNAETGSMKGVISDTYNGNTDKFYFEYTFKNGSVKAKLYDVSITTFEGTYKASDFYLDFAYEAAKDQYLVFLAYYEYDSDYQDYYYETIIGDFGDGVTSSTDLDAARYSPFARAK